jgi:DNA-binding XRE family transcriptional regulator
VADIPDLDRGRDLVKRAREIRRRAGIGMNQMAGRVGVSKTTLHVWETNPPAGLGRSPRTWGRPEFWVACLAVLDEDPDGSGHPLG